MRAVVVYESMYGNTHLVADAIAEGLRAAGDDAEVVPVEKASAAMLRDADMIVVGGPTHAHAMSRASTRHSAVEAAQKPESTLEIDPDAEGPGLRDWFDEQTTLPVRAAAFDTRIDAPPFFTGRASKGIAKRLRKHGCTLVAEPMSFLVSKDSHLLEHEAEHAAAWGKELAS